MKNNKIFDVDGIQIKVGDTVRWTDDKEGWDWKVLDISNGLVTVKSGTWTVEKNEPSEFTHRKIEAMVPEHYKMDGFESIEFVDRVLCHLCDYAPMTPMQIYSIKDALKYTIRAGKKGSWEDDAYKCADYLCRAMFGKFLQGGK